MADLDNDQFRWRETYFVWFDEKRRPKLDRVAETVRALRGHFQLENGESNADGLIESLTVRSPEDHAALEIEFVAGEEILSEAATLVAEMEPGEGADGQKLAQLQNCDARFDVMHFEQVFDEPDEDGDEMLDPSALLIVLEALIELTGGVGLDPQSGVLM